MIGTFDSGAGGLSVMSAVQKIMPDEALLYLADSGHFPYGEKTHQEIKKLCEKNIQFLKSRGAKIIVVACNTATSVALPYLRERFPGLPIIGIVPVLKTASLLTENRRIGLLATKNTIESPLQKELTDLFCGGHEIFSSESKGLVASIENNKTSNTQILEALKPLLKNKVDVIVLGCTHFHFIKDKIKKVVGKSVLVLSPEDAIARQVQRIVILTKNKSQQTANPIFFTTGSESSLKNQIKNYLGTEAKVEKVSID